MANESTCSALAAPDCGDAPLSAEAAELAAGVSADEIETLYIAGGFGSHLNVESAVAIGLLPQALKNKAKILGNAALSGAVQVLLNRNARDVLSTIAGASTHVNLGGDPKFNEKYIDMMFFGEDF